jgi:hypothetical protein
MRLEDHRPDGGGNLISKQGLSRPLSYGEQKCLEMQAKNQRLSEGLAPDVVQRQGPIAVDTTLKAPRRCSYP